MQKIGFRSILNWSRFVLAEACIIIWVVAVAVVIVLPGVCKCSVSSWSDQIAMISLPSSSWLNIWKICGSRPQATVHWISLLQLDISSVNSKSTGICGGLWELHLVVVAVAVWRLYCPDSTFFSSTLRPRPHPQCNNHQWPTCNNWPELGFYRRRIGCNQFGKGLWPLVRNRK